MYKPKIGISIGDFNGIGPEIILKTLQNPKILTICTPIIYGSTSIFQQYEKLLQINPINYLEIELPNEINTSAIYLISCWDENLTIEPGQPTNTSGNAAYLSIQKSVEHLKNGWLDALITAPIDKSNIQSEKFNFPGHTEYLLQQFGAKNGLMILTGNFLTVTTITGHISIKDVPYKIKKEIIFEKTIALHQSLQDDFGIKNPKIALLGLNPHAGDGGLFGNEEIEEITPAIIKLKQIGINVFGPFPPDGIFGSGIYKNYDALVGMYHDQVLIPFKLLEFDSGVNFTSGMSGIRTSPDHGTAFDIAGKNKANPESFQHALLKAISIFEQRKNKK